MIILIVSLSHPSIYPLLARAHCQEQQTTQILGKGAPVAQYWHIL